MKANELMIGDWVNVNGKPIKVSLDDLRTMLILYEDVDFHIEPIPLTFTMLIENGFEHQMPYNDYALGDKLALHECGEGFAVTGGIGSFNTRLQINYVHELQHLLPLIGIEKEFEL